MTALFLAGGVRAEDPFLFKLPTDSDAMIINDRGWLDPNTNLFNTSPDLLALDFDGDGKDDVAFRTRSVPSVGVDHLDLVLGKDLGASGPLSAKTHMRLLHVYSMATGDFNGDHVADLAVQGDSKVCVFFGGRIPPPLVDLDVGGGDFTILGATGIYFGSALGAGDVTGDGIDDLFIGSPRANPVGRALAGEVYVVDGRHTFPSTPVSISSGIASAHFYGAAGGRLGDHVLAANLTGDEKKELIISVTGLGGAPTEVAVFDQTTGWSSETDLAVLTPNLLITAPWFLKSEIFATDHDGDGRANLFMTARGFDWRWAVSLPGSVLPLTGTFVVENAIQTLYTVPYGIRQGHWGDFEGDGFPDVVRLDEDKDPPDVPLTLSSDRVVFSSTGTVDFMTANSMASALMADVNGDDRKDLILVENTISLSPWIFGPIHVVYGHPPLRNPRVGVKSTSPQSSRVVLELSVEGEPTEMKLSGDINDGRRDQWVPYETTFQTDWTSAEGPKTVRVKFRNSVGRESAEATAPGNLAVLSEGLAVVRNRVREGQSAVLEYRFGEPSTARVRVMGPTGADLRTLAEEDVSVGIEKWEWDGRNRFGQRVAAGIYPVVIEVNGRTEKTRVVVEW